jgi:hypothetical protein
MDHIILPEIFLCVYLADKSFLLKNKYHYHVHAPIFLIVNFVFL